MIDLVDHVWYDATVEDLFDFHKELVNDKQNTT